MLEEQFSSDIKMIFQTAFSTRKVLSIHSCNCENVLKEKGKQYSQYNSNSVDSVIDVNVFDSWTKHKHILLVNLHQRLPNARLLLKQKL